MSFVPFYFYCFSGHPTNSVKSRGKQSFSFKKSRVNSYKKIRVKSPFKIKQRQDRQIPNLFQPKVVRFLWKKAYERSSPSTLINTHTIATKCGPFYCSTLSQGKHKSTARSIYLSQRISLMLISWGTSWTSKQISWGTACTRRYSRRSRSRTGPCSRSPTRSCPAATTRSTLSRLPPPL